MGSAVVDRNTDLWVLNRNGEDSTFAPPKKEEEDPLPNCPSAKASSSRGGLSTLLIAARTPRGGDNPGVNGSYQELTACGCGVNGR